MRLAAVDIGTNTVRLLVADADGGRTRERHRLATVVGLGVGVDSTGRLDDEAVARTIAGLSALAPYVAEAERSRVVATAACRDASNREDFFDLVEATLGGRPELVAGDDEAALAFAGATAGREGGPFVVVDIGGGSTEVVAGATAPTSLVSLQVGSVRLTERAGIELPATPAMVDEARRIAGEALAAVPRPTFSEVIGVAGTYTSLAALSLGLPAYDRTIVHGSILETQALAGLVARLGSLSLAQTRALPTMEPRRAPYILGGAILAHAVGAGLDLDHVVVSEHDLLDGVIASLLPQ